mgnify:FL=1
MNFYLLNLFGKWVSLGILSIMSLFGFTLEEATTEISNSNINKNVNINSTVIEHETIETFDSSIPSNITKVITEGKDGVIYYNDDGTIVLEEVVDEEVIIGTGKNGEYTGVMTGYGPDCSTCSGRGYVSCKTEDKKNFNLINDGVYYNDDEYGEVRVLAAALSEFPCGTIVEVKSSNLGDFTGIVMDTGYTMREQLKNGVYHFDVAYETEKNEEIKKATNMSGEVIYSVQRWGW